MDLYSIAKTVNSNINVLKNMEDNIFRDNQVMDLILERLDKVDYDHFRMGPKVRRRLRRKEAVEILREPHKERTNPEMLAGITICGSEGPGFPSHDLTVSSFNASYSPQVTGDWLRATTGRDFGRSYEAQFNRSFDSADLSAGRGHPVSEEQSSILSATLGAPMWREKGTGFFSPTAPSTLPGPWGHHHGGMPTLPTPSHPNYPQGACSRGGGGPAAAPQISSSSWSPDISLEFSDNLSSTFSGDPFNRVPPSGRRFQYNVGPVAML